jgi:hypothetical protein
LVRQYIVSGYVCGWVKSPLDGTLQDGLLQRLYNRDGGIFTACFCPGAGIFQKLGKFLLGRESAAQFFSSRILIEPTQKRSLYDNYGLKKN